jgi:hypothetical protein
MLLKMQVSPSKTNPMGILRKNSNKPHKKRASKKFRSSFQKVIDQIKINKGTTKRPIKYRLITKYWKTILKPPFYRYDIDHLVQVFF